MHSCISSYAIYDVLHMIWFPIDFLFISSARRLWKRMSLSSCNFFLGSDHSNFVLQQFSHLLNLLSENSLYRPFGYLAAHNILKVRPWWMCSLLHAVSTVIILNQAVISTLLGNIGNLYGLFSGRGNVFPVQWQQELLEFRATFSGMESIWNKFLKQKIWVQERIVIPSEIRCKTHCVGKKWVGQKNYRWNYTMINLQGCGRTEEKQQLEKVEVDRVETFPSTQLTVSLA